MKSIFTAVALAASSLPAFSQITDTTTTSAPTQAQTDVSATSAASASDLTVSGYVEAYYTHDFTAPKTSQERPGFLYNHKRNREVNINLAFAKLAYVTERVRGNLAVQVGTYAQYNYAAEQNLMKNIFEANAGVKLSKNHDLWLDAGIFASHIGFESAISKDCWTLTRSILAENSPYYLSGAKLTYNPGTPDRPNGKWTFLLSVVNGWKRIIKVEGYSGPSISTQVQYRPSPKLTLNWSSFLGSDRPDSLKQTRFFNNFYAIINPVGKFGVILGFDIGSDRPPYLDGRRIDGRNFVWASPVLIARYAIGSRSYVAGRVEYYEDEYGVVTGIQTPGGFKMLGCSLNYDHAILPNRDAGPALLRIEGKLYASPGPFFETDNGLSRTNASLTTSLVVSF